MKHKVFLFDNCFQLRRNSDIKYQFMNKQIKVDFFAIKSQIESGIPQKSDWQIESLNQIHH